MSNYQVIFTMTLKTVAVIDADSAQEAGQIVSAKISEGTIQPTETKTEIEVFSR